MFGVIPFVNAFNMTVKTVEPVPLSSPTAFRISALIRITLLSLYTVLMLPLPFLAQAVQAPISPLFLAIGIGLGAIISQSSSL